jgi:acyl-CoA thioester hydrolase
MTRLRVRFAETDQMAVAHHGSYAAWFEVARVEWLRERGYAYTGLEAEGVSLAVSELVVRYRHAARFDDELRIETRLVSAASRGCRFAYAVRRDGDGALIARAETGHVAVDRTGRAVRLPDAWHAFLVREVEREPG